MDATIALAMMAKAKLVFEREDTFLSFPLTPKAYNKQQLNFMQNGGLSNEVMLNLSEFSRLVNRIPGNSVWEDTEERYLWKVYDDVMKTAKLAASNRTPAEEADYQKALQFLYIPKEGGLREDSPAVVAYSQFKDAWYIAQQNYNNKKIDAELSTDIAVKRRWQEVEEPALRSQIQSIEQRWIAEGYKVQVEEARRIQTVLGSKSPSQTWAEWQGLFNPQIDIKTDTNQMPFVITGFAPANALDSSWQRFTLSESEANALINQAPREIKQRLQPNSVDLDIESLSFEFSSVAITRSWFTSEVFKARFWQFYDSSKQISNGNIPTSGLCPSYVAALVFARNPVITLKPNSPKNKQALDRIKNLDAISVGAFRLRVKDLQLNDQTPPILQPAPDAIKPKVPIDVVVKPRVPIDAVVQPRVPIDKIKTPPIISKRIDVVSRMNSAIQFDPIVARRIDPVVLKTANLEQFQRTFKRIPIESPPIVIPPPQVPPTNPDEVYIMGFICKRLPLCPNPDSSLQW